VHLLIPERSRGDSEGDSCADLKLCTFSYQNEVEEIPKEIAVLTLLEVLKLSNNNLEKVHSLRTHTLVA
jgi:hypothetical protein